MIVEAFDQWAGRHIGPSTRDVAEVIEANPDLLGETVETAPRRFEELITDAIAASAGQRQHTTGPRFGVRPQRLLLPTRCRRSPH
ncbi:hypothetical protein [Streptomyces acidicola]|uniref:hypothetical protein n=1 Tax=Streptomyces acidicola TaxID=2596892 RepID=UPI00382B1DEB